MLENFLRSGHNFTSEESNLAYKFKVSNILSIIAIIAYGINASTFSMTPAYKDLYLTLISLSAGFILFITLFLLRIKKTFFTFLMGVNFIIITLALSYTLYFQFDNNVRIIWFIVPVILSTIIMPRWFQIILLLYAVTIVSVFLMQTHYSMSINHTSVQESLLISFILVAFTFLIQNKFSRDKQRLQELNQRLLLNKQELEVLNTNLDEQVKIELDKNKKKDEILLRQSRLLQMGELIKTIAHHWRQPLAAISSATGFALVKAEMDEFDPKDLKNTLDFVDSNVKKLSETISRFQTYFKPNENISTCSFEDVQKEIEDFSKSYFTDRKVQITFLSQKGQTFSTYKQELNNIIYSLLLNSYESLKRNHISDPKIHISMQHIEKNFLITIEDNGPMIASDVIERMFDPYYSTKEEKNNTGLGLYMAKMTVEKHLNGMLTVENGTNSVIAKIAIPSL